jgi:hypothetical protein
MLARLGRRASRSTSRRSSRTPFDVVRPRPEGGLEIVVAMARATHALPPHRFARRASGIDAS